MEAAIGRGHPVMTAKNPPRCPENSNSLLLTATSTLPEDASAGDRVHARFVENFYTPVKPLEKLDRKSLINKHLT
jgi:hypothetical protein